MAAITQEIYFGQCKCCLKQTQLKNMWFTGNEQTEVYGQMLIDCFSIDWMIQGNIDDDKICDDCISHLKLAVKFKNQVLKSQAGIAGSYNADEIKKEVEDIKEKLEQDEESLNLNGEQSEEEDGVIEFLEEEVLDDETNEDSQDSEPANKKRKRTKKLPKNERFKPYRQYTEEDLKKAVEAVKSKEMSSVKASEAFNIPRKTISKRLYDNTDGDVNEPQTAQDDMELLLVKHKDNIRSILVASNATPIRGYWGFGYACFFCPEQFAEPSQLKQHTFRHGSSIPCIKVKSLTDHIVKLDVTNLKCNICDGGMKSLDDLMLHLKQNHKMLMHLDIPNHIVPFKFNSNVLKCVKCFETFGSFKNLSEHMNDAHYRNYECEVCRRGFVNVRSLKTHCISHGINIFACIYCPKVYVSRTELVEHEKIHFVTKKRSKIPNKVANYKTKSVSPKKIDSVRKRIVSDENIEDTVKKVACDIVQELKTSQSEHRCRSCPKVFESRSDLLYHINSYHKPHKCPDCKCTFDFQFKLKKHLTKEHSIPTKNCSKCPNSYYVSDINEMFERDDYCCEVCCSSFSDEDDYMEHMKNNHGLE